jgi:hypothetical protein
VKGSDRSNDKQGWQQLVQGDLGNQDSSKRQRIGMSVRWSDASDWRDQADCDRLMVPIRLCQWLRPCLWLTAVPSYWDPTTLKGQGLSLKAPRHRTYSAKDPAALSKIFDRRRTKSPQVWRRFCFETIGFGQDPSNDSIVRLCPTMLSVQQQQPADCASNGGMTHETKKLLCIYSLVARSRSFILKQRLQWRLLMLPERR